MNKNLLFSFLLITTVSTNSFSQSVTSNSGMETWGEHTYSPTLPITTYNVVFPEQWHSSDQIVGENLDIIMLLGVTPQNQISKSTDAHSGSFAASVKTVDMDTFGVVPGILANMNMHLAITMDINPSNIWDALSYSGGTPVNGKKVDSVIAWIKLDTSSNDASGINIIATKKYPNVDTNTVIGTGFLSIVPNIEGYQRVSVPMTYMDTSETSCDTLLVTFVSSMPSAIPEDTLTPGNEMLVDDVAMVLSDGSTTGIILPLLSENALVVYPNPSEDGRMNFNLNTNLKPSEFSLIISDISGKTLYHQSLKDNINQIDCTQYASGNYFYTLIHNPSQQKENGKFALNRK